MPSYSLSEAAPDTDTTMVSENPPNVTRFHTICNRIIAIVGEAEGDMLVGELFRCIEFSAKQDKAKLDDLQAEHDILKAKYDLIKMKYSAQKQELAEARSAAEKAQKTENKPHLNEPEPFDGETGDSILIAFVRFRGAIATFFAENANLFKSEQDKTDYVVSRLTGRAIQTFYRDAKHAGRDLATLSLQETITLLEHRFGVGNSKDKYRDMVLEVQRDHLAERERNNSSS